MHRPLVSVVVPVYNGARYLGEALQSLVQQTYPSVEILVMDDASTDETPVIAQSFGASIQYHRQPANLGIYENVNAGIAMARGEFIATYHADDVYEPTIIERQVECFSRYPELAAVFCLDIFIDEHGQEYGRLRVPSVVRGSKPLDAAVVFNALLTYKNVFLVCPTAMVRRSVHQAIGVYDQVTWKNTSDIDMWIRISRNFPILVLVEYLMRYRHFPGQSSRRYHRLRREPSRFFAIMDRYLAGELGGLATGEARRAYEAHRAEDLLMIAVNEYIAGDLGAVAVTLRRARPRSILGSDKIQRARMLTLYMLLWAACRVSRSSLLAALFLWRWQSGRTYGRQPALHGLGRTLRAWWRNEASLSEPAR